VVRSGTHVKFVGLRGRVVVKPSYPSNKVSKHELCKKGEEMWLVYIVF
jgi:hypothetical protein